MKWFIITKKSGIRRVELLLQELNIGNPPDPLLFLKYGYKNISTQDKETYYLIRELAIQNKKRNNTPICFAQLDYLSIVFNTTESCQLKRLRNLQKSKLIKILPDNSIYVLDSPYPDSTFVQTIIKLLKRKRLGELITLYESCNNPLKRIEILTEINKLIYKNVKHNKLNTILSENNLIKTTDSSLIKIINKIN